MTTQIQRRRGTTAQHSTFTGALGEVTVDTDKDVVVVHDGVVAGGYPQMRENGSNSALALGSAATPALKFTGDTDTGIYSPGANQVAISTNGTGRLFVDATGRVGIGTSAPGSTVDATSASAQLHAGPNAGHGLIVSCTDTTFNRSAIVDNAGLAAGINLYISNNGEYAGFNATTTGVHSVRSTRSATPFDFRSAGELTFSSSNVERARIDSSGRVGIGTSSPSALLHARGSASAPSVSIHLQPDNNTVSNFLTFRNATDATRGYIEYNYASDYLAFASANAERMRIDSSGRVGIGTTTPYRTQTIRGTGEILQFDLNTVTNGSYASIVWNGSNVDLGASAQSAEIRGYREAGTAWGALAFHTRDASNTSLERVRIDSSGRLLVGTSSTSAPSTLLLQGASGGGTAAVSRLCSTNATPAANEAIGYLVFGDSAHSDGAWIKGARDGGTWSGLSKPTRLEFSTTADGAATPTERMRIGSDGLITIAGPGIKFPAAQVASADPNTLDDYEEGTFTPTVIGSSTAGTATYTNQTGIYTKIGRQVNWLIYVNWTGGTGSGNLQISGLPFTSANISSVNSWSVSFGIVDNIAVAANTQLNGYVSNNSSAVVLTNQVVGGGAYSVQAYDAAGHLLISGSYAAT